MAEEDLDLVVHLGDYVYEYGVPADGGARKQRVPEVLQQAPQDLDRWRMQYALYKSDPDLQRTHARFPWIVTWDDHEVANDYAGAYDETIPRPARRGVPGLVRAPAGRPPVAAAPGRIAPDLPAAGVGRPGAVRRAGHAAVPHGAGLRLGRG